MIRRAVAVLVIVLVVGGCAGNVNAIPTSLTSVPGGVLAEAGVPGLPECAAPPGVGKSAR
jgi:hypothetical protein